MNKGDVTREYVFFRPVAYGNNTGGDTMAHAQTTVVHEQLSLVFEHFDKHSDIPRKWADDHDIGADEQGY